jgi:hypothetical protein
VSDNLDRDLLLARLFGGRSSVPDGLTQPLLRTGDVALLFQVSERTVDEWARRGRIPSFLTPGGQRRYPAHDIRTLLARRGHGRSREIDVREQPMHR